VGISYQDIDTRLRVVEDKIDWIMSQFKIQKQERSYLDPTQIRTTTMTLADVYREIKNGSLIAEDPHDAA
jgi:hypothetical protein